MTIFILDGNYSNRFTAVKFNEPFQLDIHKDQTKAFFESLEVEIINFENWSPKLNNSNCRVDVEMDQIYDEAQDRFVS